jgi:hypothetical protein
MRIERVLLFYAGLTASVALAQDPAFRVIGYGAHANTGETIYHYRVINNTAGLSNPVSTGRIEIGRISLNHEPELTTEPIYDGPRYGDRVARISAPMGWEGFVSGEEEHPRSTVVWQVKTETRPYALLPPGQTLSGLSVTLPRADHTYLTSHFYISARPLTSAWAKTSGVIERADTSSPMLSLSASPNVLWPPNNKSVPITVSVAVKDDYDPYPEIRLESITSNEALGPEDVSGDATGTDDRSFSLRATRSGTNPAGRIYTITYSATDGSGNRATASTTVTVPHDQRK